MCSLLACLAMPALMSCKREKRGFRVAPPLAEMAETVPYNNPVRPGPAATTTPSTVLPVNVERISHEPLGRQYPQNAQALSDGQALYGAFNCSGCHANGGGGMGPPLLDNKWFYGEEPNQVYISIVEGRPNGMPAFRGRIPDYQVWELVAYVRSLSGQASKNAASGRQDHMRTVLPANSTPPEKPKVVPEPTTGPAVGSATGATTTATSAPTTAPATAPKPAGSTQPKRGTP